MTTVPNLTNWLYLQKCLEGVSLKSESFSLITLSRFRMVEENRRGRILPPGKIGLRLPMSGPM